MDCREERHRPANRVNQAQRTCTRPPSTCTAWACTDSAGSSRQAPVSRSKWCLYSGEATTTRPPRLPISPRDSTLAPFFGSTLSIARKRSVPMRKTAMWRVPMRAHTPVSGRMSSMAHTGVQVVVSGRSWIMSVCMVGSCGSGGGRGGAIALFGGGRADLPALRDEHDAFVRHVAVDERPEALAHVGVGHRGLPFALVRSE